MAKVLEKVSQLVTFHFFSFICCFFCCQINKKRVKKNLVEEKYLQDQNDIEKDQSKSHSELAQNDHKSGSFTLINNNQMYLDIENA
jgi:predicted transcriptional regulator